MVDHFGGNAPFQFHQMRKMGIEDNDVKMNNGEEFGNQNQNVNHQIFVK